MKDSVNMDTMPLRLGHYRVLIVASLGQVTGAGLATLVGIIIPMIQLLHHPELSSFQQGMIACLSLIGIMLGSILFGQWSDRFGYLLFFRLCPLIILTASLFVYFIPDINVLGGGLFLMGFGIGGGYSLDSDYISEIMPRRWKLLMVGVAKASSSVGNILIAAICFFLLRNVGYPELWNHLILLISAMALIMFLCRIRFEQSPGWLIAHGKRAEAEQSVRYFLGQDVDIGVIQNRPMKKDAPKISWRSLFGNGNTKKVIFSGIPWACEGFGVYGIGVFLPILIMSLGMEAVSKIPMEQIINSIKITTYINLFILPGFILGLLLVNRWYHVRTQTWAFILCSVGLVILWVGYKFHLPSWVAVAGFMIFELFLNAGPHLMTFIIPPQIYSVAERGSGAGLAASFGKLGAVIGVLFIPMLLKWGGVELVIGITIIVHLIGALVTATVGREVLPDKRKEHKPQMRED